MGRLRRYGFSLPTLASLLDGPRRALACRARLPLEIGEPEPDNRSNISRLLNLPGTEEEGEREAPSPDISKKMATFKGALASIPSACAIAGIGADAQSRTRI
jgi:hypothetical protein